MAPRKLTDSDIETVIEKRELGWSYARIAALFGVSDGAIHYQCLKNAAVSPRQRRPDTPTEPITIVDGDGRTQRRFSAAEDAQLLDLESTGMSLNAIARKLGRARTSVRIRLMTLALREDLPA